MTFGQSLLLSLVLLASLPAQAGTRALFLVPGTGNSLIPGDVKSELRQELQITPYFSHEVLEGLSSQGDEVVVARSLKGFGRLEDNSNLLQDEILSWYTNHPLPRPTSIMLFGHSAGGLYALRVASRLIELPIQKVVLVSTPLDGVELADTVFEFPLLGNWLRETIRALAPLIELEGLSDLTTPNVRDFISSLRLPENISLQVFPGAQTSTSMPPMLAWSSLWIGTENDGIVSVSSACGINTEIRTQSDQLIPIQWTNRARIPLHHAAQFMDYRLLLLQGDPNALSIRELQRKLYADVLQQFL